MHRADVGICQRDTMGNIPRMHERNIPVLVITEHHDLLNTKALHTEVRGSEVVTKKHTLFNTIIISCIYHLRMFSHADKPFLSGQ
jgi:hypothetical protein